MEIFEFIFTLLAIYLCLRLLRFVIKRLRMLKKVYSLKAYGAKITLRGFLFRPNIIPQRKYEIKVEFRDTVYYVRLFNGGGIGRFVHFASKEFIVTYSKLRIGSVVQRRRTGAFAAPVTSVIKRSPKVYAMPPFEIDESVQNKEQVKVMLFSPVPSEVSYVTKEKTSIKLAFTGDEIHGIKIFTPSTFAAYAERATRENDGFVYFK